MLHIKTPASPLLIACLCSALLLGCSEEKKQPQSTGTTMQEKLGKEAAGEAKKAAKAKKQLEGC